MLPGDYQYTIQNEFKFDKMAFDAWILEGGTLTKAEKILDNRGVRNKRTGKPYTKMGIQQAAWRYIVEQHKIVRPILERVWSEYSEEKVSDDAWGKYVVKLAMTILGKSSKERFLRWIDRNPEFMKYEYLYGVKFGVISDERLENE